MVKKIELTQGKHTLVDDEDYDFLNQWKWFAYKDRTTFYARRNIRENNKIKTILMHRIITNPEKGLVVDHINGNGLDNQRKNLRNVTRRQNSQNSQQKTSSKYPGVYWNKRDKQWRVGINLNCKKMTLGAFRSEKKAFKVYRNAVHELTGENVIFEG